MTTTKMTVETDHGIYGKKEVTGYQVDGAEGLVIYKGHKMWTITHINSGLSVDSLIPVKMKRTKAGLCAFVKAMATENAEAYFDLMATNGKDWTRSQKDAANVLSSWSREYQA